ncbi:MAG: integrin alpha [Myxococcota bacterium]|nr:integrin alpha [Myxococcota bacterium]
MTQFSRLYCLPLFALLGCPGTECSSDKGNCTGADTGELSPEYTGWPDREVSLGEVSTVFRGEEFGDIAGAALAGVGDVDGDGRSDVLVSSYWNDEAGVNAGKSYLVLASTLSEGGSFELADADYAFLGEDGVKEDDVCDGEVEGSIDLIGVCGGDWSGHNVAATGDVDGDGLSDFLISGYGADDEGLDRGRMYLVLAADLGEAVSRSLSESSVIFAGEEDGERMGHSLGAAGDVDGDGWVDLVAGSYGHDESGFDAGKAYIWSGQTLQAAGKRVLVSDADYAFVGENPLDLAGYFVSGLGDVDGDGLSDVAVAATESEAGGIGRGPSGERGSGKVYVQLGADLAPGTTMDLGSASYSFAGENGGDTLGYGTRSAGDLDDDGLSDLLLGAYGNNDGGTDSGKAYVVLGAELGERSEGSLSEAAYQFVGTGHDLAGQSNANLGDIDLDGRPDFLISARKDIFLYEHTGGAYLVLSSSLDGPGTRSLTTADHHFLGEGALDQAGYAVSAAGDVDGNGLNDLLIGAWQGEHVDQTGKAYLVFTP